MTRMASSEALGIGSALLRDIGMLFPVQLVMRGADLQFTLALSESQLGHRTTGPYSEQHLPTELATWAELRAGMGMAGRFPRFSFDASGQWARVLVELEGTAVKAVVVVPEEVTAETLDATHLGTWQDSMATSLRMALDDLSHRLYQCYGDSDRAEPLIDLRMEYRRVEDYDKLVTETHPLAKEFITPVRPVLAMRWRAATSRQRKAFLEALDTVERTGSWPGRRLTTRISDVELVLPKSR